MGSMVRCRPDRTSLFYFHMSARIIGGVFGGAVGYWLTVDRWMNSKTYANFIVLAHAMPFIGAIGVLGGARVGAEACVWICKNMKSFKK